MLNARGWAAIIVDSHGPRGFSDYEIWRLICAGQLFMGSERAGDVLVSLDDARRMAFVDPRRIALIGASHGGWAIMDLLALDPPARLPFNLAALPAGARADPLAGVVGIILLYPYCGPGNRARPDGWRRPIPALFLLSDSDAVAPAEDCLEIAERMQARGCRSRRGSSPASPTASTSRTARRSARSSSTRRRPRRRSPPAPRSSTASARTETDSAKPDRSPP